MSGSPQSSNRNSLLGSWSQLKLLRLRLPIFTVPLALLAICLISYGLMLSKLGVHFDDWSLVWVIHFLKPLEFVSAYSVDRPLLGWLLVLTTSLFGENLLAWLIFGLIIRWLSCVALWWALRGLWPRRTLEVTALAFLFAVYPGFISIHIPITRAHHILILALTLFSLGALNWALRLRRYFWLLYITSIVSAGLALFTMEYYFGLELLRPLFLWMILGEQIVSLRKRLQQMLIYYLPFSLVVLSFLLWRMLTPTPRGSVTLLDKIVASPLDGLVTAGKTVVQDVFEASALAWGQAVNFGKILAGYDSSVLIKYILIVATAAVFSFIFLSRLDAADPYKTESPFWRRRASNLILLGVLALLLGGIPVWMTDLHLELAFPWDRFTISMILGASLLLFGFLELFTWRGWQLLLLTSLIVGLGAGMHFMVTLSIRRDWQSQKDFFWQLAWRAPALKTGTTVLVSELPFTYNSSYSLTAPLDWQYAPQDSSYSMPYVLYDARINFSDANIQSLSEGQVVPVEAENRMLSFHGSTAQAIFVVFRPPGCLKVIDPAKDQSLPAKPPLFRELTPLSDVNLIFPDAGSPARPPAHYFGAEPERSWCYYFEQADLARQMGNWQAIADLGDIALSKSSKLSPKDGSELLPFIIGYGHLGKWEKAFELTNRAFSMDKRLKTMLCNTWDTLSQQVSLDSQDRAFYDRIRQQIQCGS
jgi:hypothetical protein